MRRSPMQAVLIGALAGALLGCQPPPPAPTPQPVQDAPGLTAQERQEGRARMDCYTLGAFAWKVANERAELGLTQEEALYNVAQVTMEHLRTTATPDTVAATGLRLRAIVRLVYIFPAWTPDEAAFHSRNMAQTQQGDDDASLYTARPRRDPLHRPPGRVRPRSDP